MARVVGRTLSCASITKVSMPACPSRNAVSRPTGPAPTMSTVVLSLGMTSYQCQGHALWGICYDRCVLKCISHTITCILSELWGFYPGRSAASRGT
jgi:hypothetical protein